MQPDEMFVDYVTRQLVEYPEDVRLDREVDEKGVLIRLTVNKSDLGRVIGKKGATAQALRTLLHALGSRNNARYNLKIEDGGAKGE